MTGIAHPGCRFRRAGALAAALLVAAVLVRAQDPTRLESEIAAFERADAAKPPPPAPVVFTGSSSIRMWPALAAAFPDQPVLNRGFGGSEMSDLLHYFDRVVTVYRPPLVVVYEGDNDLAAGESPARVLAEYEQFVARVHAALPGTGILLLAVKPSPSRAAWMDAQRALNAGLRDLAAFDPAVGLVDVFTPMLGSDGLPRRELFLSDQLHLTPAGYAVWHAALDPVLDRWMGRGVPQPLGFTREPADGTGEEFHAAVFEAAVEGSPPIAVQWLTNGVPVPGARALRLTLDPVTPAMEGTAVAVVATHRDGSLTSRHATLHVVPDVTSPVPVSATSVDGRHLALTFSERLAPLTARDPARYRVTGGGVAVTNVTDAGGPVVELTLDRTLTGVFAVQVEGVSDPAGNRILPGASVTGEVLDPARQPWLFDFGPATRSTTRGPAPNDPDWVWNNVTPAIGTVPSGRLLNLVDRLGRKTDAGLVILRRFNGTHEDGLPAPGEFPANACVDSLFGNTEPVDGLGEILPAFRLFRLDPDLAYDLEFHASAPAAGGSRETVYTVLGARTATATLEPAGNATGTATVPGMRPSAAGEINLTLAAGPANDRPPHFTALGALRVTPRLPELRILARLLPGARIRLDWTGPGTPQWAPTIAGPWTSYAPGLVPPLEESVAEAVARYFRVVGTTGP